MFAYGFFQRHISGEGAKQGRIKRGRRVQLFSLITINEGEAVPALLLEGGGEAGSGAPQGRLQQQLSPAGGAWWRGA
ncbi:hypothetical protein PBY51_015595 [Eleginops maclovinus]|uniref:Uncharacterized protein n=1 Tax=Eleginops maclovinus TaxID=56733 RepID=A0AAN7XHH4_ELEMC|nr:hypothetical protein PBY51_015595 [Eleginops maclovinus]